MRKKESFSGKSRFMNLVVFVMIIMACNMSINIAKGQIIYFPDAVVRTATETSVTGISADSNNVYATSAGQLFTVEEAQLTFYADESIIIDGVVGGVGHRQEGGSDVFIKLSDFTEILTYSEITSPASFKKGIVNDTSVFTSNIGSFLKIGANAPVELVGPTGTIKGYVITNGHIHVYEFLSSTQTTFWDFDVTDLGNPTSEVIDESVSSITFIDTIQVKFSKVSDEWHTYYLEPSIGWQQIDDNIFNGNYYYDYALSYYGDDNDVCISCLDPYTGNIMQIYTEGFIATITVTPITGVTQIGDDFECSPTAGYEHFIRFGITSDIDVTIDWDFTHDSQSGHLVLTAGVEDYIDIYRVLLKTKKRNFLIKMYGYMSDI